LGFIPDQRIGIKRREGDQAIVNLRIRGHSKLAALWGKPAASPELNNGVNLSVIIMSRDEMVKENPGAPGHVQVDPERFENMMLEYRPPAMALALNVLGNREDAEDACQDTFVSAYHSLESHPLPSNLKGWILTILYRRCLDILRRRQRSTRLAQRVQAQIPRRISSPCNPLGNPSSPVGKLALSQRVLQALTEKERLAISLWANEDYSTPEIAGILGCSEATARVHLFRARRKIKSMVEKGHDSLSTR
jgi:RNA polymerase sigma-70 factor (ECF subfamily)